VKPITALRRAEADIVLLRIEVRDLCQQVSAFDEAVRQTRQDLEELAARFEREFQQREQHRRDRENK
jgi:DNA-directed RNA polymerase subunit L